VRRRILRRGPAVNWPAFVHEHGYAIAFAGSVLEGETVLTLAGLTAHRGYLWLPLLIVVGALGAFIGDQGYFLAGRNFGPRILGRWPRLNAGAARVGAMLERHPGRSVVAVRFLYGLRTVGPVAIGMSDMAWHTFALYNALGAVLWASCWASAGYVLGNVAEVLLGDLEHAEKWIFIVAVSAAMVVTIVLRVRRRSAMACG
jgi:membrane protein DedA with SNARE-associated domain